MFNLHHQVILLLRQFARFQAPHHTKLSFTYREGKEKKNLKIASILFSIPVFKLTLCEWRTAQKEEKYRKQRFFFSKECNSREFFSPLLCFVFCLPFICMNVLISRAYSAYNKGLRLFFFVVFVRAKRKFPRKNLKKRRDFNFCL